MYLDLAEAPLDWPQKREDQVKILWGLSRRMVRDAWHTIDDDNLQDIPDR